MKARRYATLTSVEVVIVLEAIAEEAKWSSVNAEEPDSPQQKDQTMIYVILTQAAHDIDAASRKNWEGV